MNDSTEIQRSFSKTYGYWACQQFCRLSGIVGWRVRCFGQEHIPASGGGLVCANHQSHLDPVIIGCCSPRRMNFLARKSLFRFKPFATLIDFLDAIPLEREGIGIAGIKETIRRTRRGELLLLFPEGARTFDGEVAPFLPGAASIARRARVPIIPVGIDGAFQAWPRTQAFPKLGHVAVCIQKPIPFSEYGSLSEDRLIALLQDRIQDCFDEARSRRERAV